MRKTLSLSTTDRVLTGVCGGLAEYFSFNANVIRLIFIVTFFVGFGSPLLIYIVLYIIMKFR